MAKFASGKWALGECDRCGQTFKLNALKELVIAGIHSGWMVCEADWEPDNPRLQVPKQFRGDAEALRNPRPPRSNSRNIAWGWNPVFSEQMKLVAGAVTVDTGE